MLKANNLSMKQKIWTKKTPVSDDEISSDGEPEINVLGEILDEAETLSVLESFKRTVTFCRSLKRDET